MVQKGGYAQDTATGLYHRMEWQNKKIKNKKVNGSTYVQKKK
jgi:hypothetical protein